MSQQQSKALKDFIVEAEDILETLAEDLEKAQEQFEENGKVKPALTNKIFRGVHSLKGLASMFNLERITQLSHDLETLLDKARLGKVAISGALFALLEDCRSALRTLVAEAKTGKEETDIEGLLARIAAGPEAPVQANIRVLDGLLLDNATLQSFTEYEEHRLEDNLAEGSRIFSIKVGFDFSDFDTRLRALTEKLSDTGEVISTLPVVDPEITDGIHFRLIYGTAMGLETLEQHVSDEKGVVENLLPPKPDADSEKKKEQEANEKAKDADIEDFRDLSNTVKVDIDKLDAVIGIVGEMNLLRVALERLASNIHEVPGQKGTALRLSKQVRLLGKKLGELQRSVIDIRLVPIGQSFNRLKRTANRLARAADKQISVRLYGGETELDKMIMDKLITPLVHIIRNSIDHGIEPPEERTAAGKPLEGLITISAYQKGNSIIVEVSDDGRGLQEDKIRAAAVKKGLVGPEVQLTSEECLDFIFLPGFSSSENVTTVSGRGVGLDVVKTEIQAMKGSIDVLSERLKGVTFQIQLPITLAIIQSLIVNCCDELFAIPISSVLETFKTTEGEIQIVDKQEVLDLRGYTLPLLRLEKRFSLKRTTIRKKEDIFVVVAHRGDKAVGLIVDELTGEQETVVHPIGSSFSHLPGVAGATEVGEDQVILVIDTASLFATMKNSTK